jgi:hypothetical protein
MMKNFLTGTVMGILTSSFLAADAEASIIGGISGTRSATVEFDVVGTNLLITLTNTSTRDVGVPADVLTAVFFDIADGAALTPVSAELAANSSLIYASNAYPTDGVVGGEWAYRDGLTNAPGMYGISSAGLGLFGPHDRFPGANLGGPNSPAGIQYGIVPAGDITATGNGGVTGSGGLIKSSVVFTLRGWKSKSAPSVSKVWFQFGTGLNEPRIPGVAGASTGEVVPESSSIVAWTVMLFGAIPLYLRNINRHSKPTRRTA